MKFECPFCGNTVHTHNGIDNILYFTCGQKDDGSDGCGAVISFRTYLTGDEAKRRFNARHSVKSK